MPWFGSNWFATSFPREGWTDAPPDTSTPYFLSHDGEFRGDSFRGDVDVIALDLRAGQSYYLFSNSLIRGTEIEMLLLAEDNSVLAEGHPFHAGRMAYLTFTAPEDMRTWVSVERLVEPRDDNMYRLSLVPVEPGQTFKFAGTQFEALTPAPISQIADYLIDGYWDWRGVPASSWDFDARGAKALTYDISNLTADGARVAAYAFQAWTDISGIVFTPVSDNADITITTSDRTGAWAWVDQSAGRTTAGYIDMYRESFDPAYPISNNWYAILVHEIGHVLGLGHPGPYNGGGFSYQEDALFSNDTDITTIMSYWRGDEELLAGVPGMRPMTPGAADMAAIEMLYGPVSVNAGDTVYGAFTDHDDLSQLPQGLLGSYTAAEMDLLGEGISTWGALYTIRDDGGEDLVDSTNNPNTDGLTIDITIPGPDEISLLAPVVALAPGTVLEHVNGGAWGDEITGNAVANKLRGNGGHDLIEGHGGDDTIVGGAGNDTLLGGAGADVFAFETTAGGADVLPDFGLGADLIGLSTLLHRADRVALLLEGAGPRGTPLVVEKTSGRLTSDNAYVSLSAAQVGDDTVLTVNSAAPATGFRDRPIEITLTFENTLATDLTLGDFLL